MKTKLLDGERIIKEGGANLQKNIETVGGKLYLTNLRLIWESHALNIQTGTVEILLPEIVTLEGGWTKLLGLIPLIPNAIIIYTKVHNYRITLFGKKDWINRIQQEISKKD